MGKNTIELRDVSKCYDIRERKFRVSKSKNTGNNILWALKNVSFDVKEGEAIGIIGANGSGKTTILRLLAGVTDKTSGDIKVKGSIAPLIQIGAGFHPELTGRENIYLNGIIMGLSKKQIGQKFNQIIQFAELEKFIDTPVKRYSSGMYVRLGFSVAIHIDADILLIDEILSVGDVSFRRKCLDAMHRIRKSDKTIVFISHNLSAVRGLCDRVIWLDKGEIKKEGDRDKVIGAYVDYMTSKSEFMYDISYKDNKTRWGTGEVRFQNIKLMNSKGEVTDTFLTAEEVKVVLEFKAYKEIISPTFWLGLLDKDENWVSGFVFNKDNVKGRLVINGDGCLECVFETKNLHPGAYYITVGVFDEFCQSPYDRIGRFSKFNLVGEMESFSHTHWRGIIKLPNRWKFTA